MDQFVSQNVSLDNAVITYHYYNDDSRNDGGDGRAHVLIRGRYFGHVWSPKAERLPSVP
eukprot:CAMPEP_0172482468 /NCGR_PEP_ID=MMETSP1066-20121228/8887_1 /TAXON_ID=671091 /ORGANISM="Coscinodiscus wailesii, Strain CCMP2513" /LENGTH=58 /DNA_ID=CAMNT_0013245607 /DNA_START=329 /DNA_END=505 /DNA_ORIENTATION=+